MSFATLASELLSYVHNSNDATAMKNCLVQALRQLRGRRCEWGQGSAQFITEAEVSAYPFGAYPHLPGGFMSFVSADPTGRKSSIRCDTSTLASAVLRPDTLLVQTNLTGAITDVQDSAQEPDDDYLDPTTAATWTCEVRWDEDLARPLRPGTVEGFGAQIMRVAMYSEGTSRSVTWQLKEGGSNVTGASGSWTVNNTNPTVYEAKWDAALLSTLDPAGEQISLEITDASSGGDVHIGAIQWFVRTRNDFLPSSSGGRLRVLSFDTFRALEGLGGQGYRRRESINGIPSDCAVWDGTLHLYPAPSGSYLVSFDYLKDATRDATTNAKITSSATTETNDWIDGDGKFELVANAIELYSAMRPQDAKAMALAQAVGAKARGAQDLAHELGVFASAPSGCL